MKDFADKLRGWVQSLPIERAEPAQPAEPASKLSSEHGCACSAGCARPDQEHASDAFEARFTREERLAIASDLGMDTSAGTDAETIAFRESRRAAAGVPATWNTSREADLIDHALAAFESLGGLTFVTGTNGSGVAS